MYWKGEAELLEDRSYDYGCNSRTPLRDEVGSFKKKELIRLWNSILLEPGQPSAQLTKLIIIIYYYLLVSFIVFLVYSFLGL